MLPPACWQGAARKTHSEDTPMQADGSGQAAVPGSGPLDTLYGWSPDGRWLLVESSRDVNAMAVSSGSERLHKDDS